VLGDGFDDEEEDEETAPEIRTHGLFLHTSLFQQAVLADLVLNSQRLRLPRRPPLPAPR
jgi:hypothetical protein